MRDDAVLRRALPLGQGLGRLYCMTGHYKNLFNINIKTPKYAPMLVVPRSCECDIMKYHSGVNDILDALLQVQTRPRWV